MGETAREILQQKLAHFEQELAKKSDPEQKFELLQRIKETKQALEGLADKGALPATVPTVQRRGMSRRPALPALLIVVSLVGVALLLWRSLPPKRVSTSTSPPAASPALEPAQALLGHDSPYAKTDVTLLTTEDMPFPDVLKQLASQAKIKLALGPLRRDRIEMKVQKAKLGKVLDDLCDAYSCDWHIIELPEPILFVNPRSNPGRRQAVQESTTSQ